MSNKCQSISFNIEIDHNTEIYRAIHSFSLEKAGESFNRKDAVANMTKTLEKILFNLLTGMPSYHISMRKEKVDRITRYQEEVHRYKYRKISLDILEELDFISQDKGSRWRHKQTTIYPTDVLFNRFNLYGSASYYINQNELLVLRETTNTHWHQKIKRNIEYEDTNETNIMREEVERINSTLRALNIQYPSISSIHTNDPHTEIPFTLLAGTLCKDTTDNQIYRVFSHGSFDLGGRMYGGYWINLKKRLRKGMTINDEPCSEVDFNSMHIAQLYAMDGYYHSDDYDAYDILELLAMGVSRSGIKKQVQRMINKDAPATSFSHCSDATIRREFKGLDYDTAIQPILDKHDKIAKHFYSGIGLKLANDEARIMIDVIKQLIRLNIPALPLHDALITQNKHAKKVQELMQERFLEFYGVPISAGIKHL
jgi:hypothetical protein